MAKARAERFSDKDAQLAEWCKALGHPARIAILKTLAVRKECVCGDLVTDLPLAQSTVSQHLKQLKDAGLIDGVVDGPRSRYCLNSRNFRRLVSHLADFASAVRNDLQDQKC
jgi:ArsR family transcriptional regulator